mgnify:CR=1 FL=1
MDLYGEKRLGNVSEPTLGEIYGDKVTYYVRKGKHFLSRDGLTQISFGVR